MLRKPHNILTVSVVIITGVVCSSMVSAQTAQPESSAFRYDSKGKRDPFVSLLGRDVQVMDAEIFESIDQVKVEGVIIDEQKGSAALVNGTIIKVGEFIGGFRLDKVTNYTLEMSRDGQTYKIQFRNKEEDEKVR